ncbi:MAG: hypothetical protein L3J71_03540 [Victivallaceae bacterium]|nr:hypothetical protein [Victivallaceae bacterium]
MKTRTVFAMLLISTMTLTGLLMITVTGCNSVGADSISAPTVNPEIRNQVVSIVMTISKIAANTYIEKMVTDGKITAADATTYKQIVQDINVPAANDGSSGASGTPDNASP